MWRTYTMSELYDLLVTEKSSVFSKPKFPTRRWGQCTTINATTDKLSIERGIAKLKEQGKKVRKRIDYAEMERYPKLGKFYKIEIYEISL